MRALLSTIGSRGDVQPLLALALRLRELDVDVRMCVPPDFREWIEGFGVPVTPIGPELRSAPQAKSASGPPDPAKLRSMMEGTVAAQFETISAAAAGCDLIVGATALQLAAPSIAEKLGVPYVFAAFCPVVLPSSSHAPPVLSTLGDTTNARTTDFEKLWADDALRWNAMWAPFLNPQREKLDLDPVDDVRGYVLTDRPWLAADPVIAPWPTPGDSSVVQTGAWILPDDRPLPTEVEEFLASGAPPVYIGFGSMRVTADTGLTMVDAARALGYRVIVGRGWADLSPAEDLDDCIVVDEVNQQALFRHVAAVVHHGGAGTTTTAALAGAPQVILPQMHDQYYFAKRVFELGIGAADAAHPSTVESLTACLEDALRPEVSQRTRFIAGEIRLDGADVAARRLLDMAV